MAKQFARLLSFPGHLKFDVPVDVLLTQNYSCQNPFSEKVERFVFHCGLPKYVHILLVWTTPKAHQSMLDCMCVRAR